METLLFHEDAACAKACVVALRAKGYDLATTERCLNLAAAHEGGGDTAAAPRMRVHTAGTRSSAKLIGTPAPT